MNLNNSLLSYCLCLLHYLSIVYAYYYSISNLRIRFVFSVLGVLRVPIAGSGAVCVETCPGGNIVQPSTKGIDLPDSRGSGHTRGICVASRALHGLDALPGFDPGRASSPCKILVHLKPG